MQGKKTANECAHEYNHSLELSHLRNCRQEDFRRQCRTDIPKLKSEVTQVGDNLEKTEIQWHPGFYGAAELELISNKDSLEFQREINLSKMPLQMDLLIIKKLADVEIENEIGRIFKKYNVLEYKSPADGLSIDDYYKTLGYACLYKSLGDTVNQIPAEELTVSVFRDSYPPA